MCHNYLDIFFQEVLQIAIWICPKINKWARSKRMKFKNPNPSRVHRRKFWYLASCTEAARVHHLLEILIPAVACCFNLVYDTLVSILSHHHGNWTTPWYHLGVRFMCSWCKPGQFLMLFCVCTTSVCKLQHSCWLWRWYQLDTIYISPMTALHKLLFQRGV